MRFAVRYRKANMPTRVLVADDSQTIRKIVQICLDEAGIEVIEAACGEEAQSLLLSDPPDLVLADVAMPGPDGYELCERLKAGEFGRSVPVILMADPFAPFDTQRAIAAGADGQITKPFEATSLLSMVGEQLGGEAGERALEAIRGYPQEEAVMLDDDTLTAGATTRFSPGSGIQTGSSRLSPSDVEAVARRVVSMLSDEVVREIAWEVVPELSEVLIREKLKSN